MGRGSSIIRYRGWNLEDAVGNSLMTPIFTEKLAVKKWLKEGVPLEAKKPAVSI